MSANHDKLRSLQLFLTAEHRCSYLPGRSARNMVADPLFIDNDVYSQLAGLGFRRSGSHVYRPHCKSCRQCLSLRIPVQQFRPNRSQRRTWKMNQDLRVSCAKTHFNLHHYQLFSRYLKFRHLNAGMDETTPESYLSFIAANWSDTLLYEFRLGLQVAAVAVVDRLEHGLSAVYTFFDPDQFARGLGTYAILWQIAEAKRLQLAWLYLGYWVRDCDKMAYKANFRPHEVFTDGLWISVPR